METAVSCLISFALMCYCTEYWRAMLVLHQARRGLQILSESILSPVIQHHKTDQDWSKAKGSLRMSKQVNSGTAGGKTWKSMERQHNPDSPELVVKEMRRFLKLFSQVGQGGQGGQGSKCFPSKANKLMQLDSARPRSASWTRAVSCIIANRHCDIL